MLHCMIMMKVATVLVMKAMIIGCIFLILTPPRTTEAFVGNDRTWNRPLQLAFVSVDNRQKKGFTSYKPKHVSLKSKLHSTVQNKQSSTSTLQPWYSDPLIGKDRTTILARNPVINSNNAKFVISTGKGHILHQSSTTTAQPVYLSAEIMNKIVLPSISLTENNELIASETIESIADRTITRKATHTCIHLVAWVGKFEDIDYWIIHINNRIDNENALKKAITANLPRNLLDESNNNSEFNFLPLREFGDRLTSTIDAGLLGTGNGLMEFHQRHQYCSKCGSITYSQKVGSSRRCSNTDCKASYYPRLDVASIMLIADSTGQYALLGRKSFWPTGRYSTLSGFVEVGETVEQSCIRETFEESGIVVNPTTVQYIASQPWPFPQSLMIGFLAKAYPFTDGDSTSSIGVVNNNADVAESIQLPKIQIETTEMEDIRWFHKEYVKERLQGGSTALTHQPTTAEQEFHIPGRSSLARILITKWCESD